MLELERSNVFKRDIKQVRSQGKKFDLLNEVVNLLLNQESLPLRYCNHKLTGNYNGYMELHIQPDWLLIYKIDHKILFLARTGSHSDLFA